MNEIINLSKIYKSFGAVQALIDFNVSINAGEVVGLMGDNGAGKSTLLKIIAGNFLPTSGSINFSDKEVIFNNPNDARKSGIEVVYQDLALCDHLTAAKNIYLSREIRKFGVLLDHKKMNDSAQTLLDELNSSARPDDVVTGMSGGQRQAIAIARTRLSAPKIVLMDEPTAAVSVAQVPVILQYIKKLQEQGIAVLLISHRLPDVMNVCDRVVVMRLGEKVCDKSRAECTPELITGLITGAIVNA
jgi:simple sugar transport system ATP-binding protein